MIVVAACLSFNIAFFLVLAWYVWEDYKTLMEAKVSFWFSIFTIFFNFLALFNLGMM